ncbi:hypothetical protein MBLNU230_g6474t1 [Neophaeotheca triangularis]
MASSPPNNTGTSPSRPTQQSRQFTAPSVMTMNGHFGSATDAPTRESFEHGCQVIDEDKHFNANLPAYLQLEDITRSGFNYHLISVFGSQSTGKSTLLNALFGTQFGVMSERERRQTTKGIWMSKNKNVDGEGNKKMAENILVMDVEGTDGRERGEDQDFERKSALFALATSEVLIVNIWEHQVGLYQGANMGLLKTVFEVNLQLFLKDAKSVPRSLLFFVIRDHLGTTPLENLRETLMQDLSRIWSTLNKPPGLEKSRIEDYFDFAFVALPHKVLQPEKFESEVKKLGTRFREGYKDPKRTGLVLDEQAEPILLPEYHRRIPADGFPMYANGVWEQIDSNKDLDLPTQQELLAQFRCDEISKEVLVAFDAIITPFEERQAEAVANGKPGVLDGLGKAMTTARETVLKDFETEASRYHKGVFKAKQTELAGKVDSRLKSLFTSQLSGAHKSGVAEFSEAVSGAVKLGQKKGGNYDFQTIVTTEKKNALDKFEREAKGSLIQGTPWSDYSQQLNLYRKDLEEVSARLRREEMRRLASRSERWVKARLSESVGLEFNKLGSGRAGDRAPAEGTQPTEKDLWDRVWNVFTDTVAQAETRFTDRARSFDASPEEVEVGLWRLRRKSWAVLRAKIDEEIMEGNLLLKLRENFEDKFRYDEDGVPRIWRPTDDIERLYTRARESTLELIPLLSRFHLSRTSAPPPLDAWIGAPPASTSPDDEEDMPPIGGVDADDTRSLAEETTLIPPPRQADLTTRFKKTADGVYVEAKRSAIGGVTQVPLYFYGLLLALGWNEIVTVLRNPVYFILLILTGVAAYVTWTLNLWGPMLRMGNAASAQGVEIFREKLRGFLEGSEVGREAIGLSQRGSGGGGGSYEMEGLSKERGNGSAGKREEEDVDEI